MTKYIARALIWVSCRLDNCADWINPDEASATMEFECNRKAAEANRRAWEEHDRIVEEMELEGHD